MAVSSSPVPVLSSVLSRWNEGMDTASIAEAVKVHEAVVAGIVEQHQNNKFLEMRRRQGLPLRASEANKAAFAARDEIVVRLRSEGHSQEFIARSFGVTAGRISQILKAAGVPRCRNKSDYERWPESRMTRLVELYNAGLTLSEIAEREGVSVPALCNKMQCHPRYQARRGGGFAKPASELEVPAWVPSTLIPRFIRIALHNGEEVACSCIRNAKRLGILR